MSKRLGSGCAPITITREKRRDMTVWGFPSRSGVILGCTVQMSPGWDCCACEDPPRSLLRNGCNILTIGVGWPTGSCLLICAKPTEWVCKSCGGRSEPSHLLHLPYIPASHLSQDSNSKFWLLSPPINQPASSFGIHWLGLGVEVVFTSN